MVDIQPIAKTLIEKAKQEIADERTAAAIVILKRKLREKAAAQTVVDNIDREIADLELQITQGNL